MPSINFLHFVNFLKKFRNEKLFEIASLNTTYVDSHKNKVIPSLTLAESKKGGCCNTF